MTENPLNIVDHLEELRQRMIVSMVAILVATALAFAFSDRILQVLLAPSGGLQLRAFSLLDGLMIKWRIALYAGIVLASPVWVYEVFRFIDPGLLPQERRALYPAFGGSLLLFAGGTLFGYTLLREMIRVLLQFFPSQIQYLPSANDYLSFVTFFLLACGVAFQLPTILTVLVQLRILTSVLLRKHRRWAYFLLFAFAEIITPVSDPIVAPLTVMAPLVILYELSIWLALRIEKRRERALAVLTPHGKPDFHKCLYTVSPDFK